MMKSLALFKLVQRIRQMRINTVLGDFEALLKAAHRRSSYFWSSGNTSASIS